MGRIRCWGRRTSTCTSINTCIAGDGNVRSPSNLLRAVTRNNPTFSTLLILTTGEERLCAAAWCISASSEVSSSCDKETDTHDVENEEFYAETQKQSLAV